MPTFKRYSGIKACEDFVQRCDSSSSNGAWSSRTWFNTAGEALTNLNRNYNISYGGKNIRYLSCETVKASADEYNENDYNGTSTGNCQFTKNVQTGGVSYQIQFTATETATIKCFKFIKELGYITNAPANTNALMFAVYFDEPISVTSGQILNMSINFAYDEEQVTII